MIKRATPHARAARTAPRNVSKAAPRRSSWKRRLKTALALCILLLETLIAAALVSSLVIFYRFSHHLPNVEDIANDIRPVVPTTIWSQDGVLLGKLEVENRQPITLMDMPNDLINATVAIEDHRFYLHSGVDIPGIGSAIVANLSGSSATRRGASTLTQQLVRNVDTFGISKKKSYGRKIREALTAIRVEQVYSKREILALYMNNVYYGGGAYGVQAAARTFFGKSAYKLDLSEAALLAGLPQRPSAFSPFEHRASALARRDEVLDAMQKYGYITGTQCAAAKEETLKFVPQQKHRDYNFKAPFFVWYVLNDLFKRYGTEYVYSGLRIETSLNWKIQEQAEQQLELGIQKSKEFGCNQGALIALDNGTGYIRAMVGGRNFRASQYNIVTQGRRQPGSSFKLFDYSAAFNEDKCSIDSTFLDHPISYPNNPEKVVKNFGGSYSYREMSCRQAIASSVNTVAVQVARLVGITKVISYAHKMGITSELAPYLPTALGASPVHPIDLCEAYSIIANKGSHYHPMALTRVTDVNSDLVEEHVPQPMESILKESTISQMDEALAGVVDHGSGTKARGDETNGIVEGAHGKTGTTTDARDAWFAGYTPEMTAVLWVGNVHRDKKGAPVYETMGGATGGQVCAPIWHDFMIKAIPEERRFKAALQGGVLLPPLLTADETENSTGSTGRRHRTAKPVKVENAVKPPQPAVNGAGPTTDNPGGPPQEMQNPPIEPVKGADTPDAPGGQTAPKDGTQPNGAAGANTNPPTVALTNPPAGSQSTRPPSVTVTNPTIKPHVIGNQSGSLTTSRTPTTHTVIPPKPTEPETVDVLVCVDSGNRATMWCPVTKTVQMSREEAKKLRRCRLHKPPPGAG